jgi:transcriptional regulator with XRE-family HTH domain
MKPLTEYIAREQTTQAALAQRLGVHPSMLSLILSGSRQPGIALTKKIEAVTGIPRRDLRPDIFGDAQ